MSKKPIHPKTMLRLCITVLWIGAAIALLSRTLGPVWLWVGLGITLAGAIGRYSLVKCPHCGCKLNESKTIPSKCPNCQETL